MKPFLIAIGVVIGLGVSAVLVVPALAAEEIRHHMRTLITVLGSASEQDVTDYKEGVEWCKRRSRQV